HLSSRNIALARSYRGEDAAGTLLGPDRNRQIRPISSKKGRPRTALAARGILVIVASLASSFAPRLTYLFPLVMDSRTAPLPPHRPLRRYYGNEAERRRRITQWFDAAARHYDWITQAASFGTGTWYRNDALIRAGLGRAMSVLDVGSGTGGVAAQAQAIV